MLSFWICILAHSGSLGASSQRVLAHTSVEGVEKSRQNCCDSKTGLETSITIGRSFPEPFWCSVFVGMVVRNVLYNHDGQRCITHMIT
jgi:hypothetical protein